MLTDLMGGQIPLFADPMVSSLPLAQSGKKSQSILPDSSSTNMMFGAACTVEAPEIGALAKSVTADCASGAANMSSEIAKNAGSCAKEGLDFMGVLRRSAVIIGVMR